MKRWNGIEMGFRKRDKKEQERRQQRANETAFKYASKKNGTAMIVMSDELNTFKKSIKYTCATCLELGLEADECPLYVMPDRNITDFNEWLGNIIDSKEWKQYPVFHLECEAGHIGQILLSEILIIGKYPVYLEFANIGVSWLEDGFAMGDIQSLIDAGCWPVDEEE